MAADDAPVGAKQFRALRIMTILVLLAGAGCTSGQGERVARVELDCQHRDKDICLVANAIRDQLLEAMNGRTQVSHSKQVEQDVGAILNGMRRNGADADARVRDMVSDPMASAADETTLRRG
jgi:hypothetical protein